MERWKSVRARVCANSRSFSMFLALAVIGLLALQVQITSQTTPITQAKDPGYAADQPLPAVRSPD